MKLIDKLKQRKGVLIVKLLHFGFLTLQLDIQVLVQADAMKGVLIVKLLHFGSLTLQLDSEVDRQAEAKKVGIHCKTITSWLSDPST